MSAGANIKLKVALITGASQRIGAAIAAHLHGNGYNVFIHYRSSADAAAGLVDQLNRQRANSAVCGQADFSNLHSCEQLVVACVKQWGQLDLLVNNASEFFPTAFGSIGVDDIERTFTANVYAPLLLVQSANQYLQASAGSVVNIVDIYANIVHRNHAVYCGSKAALAMLTRSLAVELAPGVRVNGVAPGAILWPDAEAALSEDAKSEVLGKVPLQRMGTAEHIAAAVLYLASEDAGFVTGEILNVDGGRAL